MYRLSVKLEQDIFCCILQRILRRISHKIECHDTCVHCRSLSRILHNKPLRKFYSPVTLCIYHYRHTEIAAWPYKSDRFHRIGCIKVASVLVKEELSVLVNLCRIDFNFAAGRDADIKFLKHSVSGLESYLSGSSLNRSACKHKLQ